MSWIHFSLIAIGLVGISDVFRKLASNLRDPLFANLVFQIGSVLTAILLFAIYSRKVETNPRDITYALIGGALISAFSLFSFKALSSGPGVSTVMPTLRIGGVAIVAVLGVLILKERLTFQTITGILLSSIGIYLIFSNK